MLDKRFQEKQKIESYREWAETPAEQKIYWPFETWKKEYLAANGKPPGLEEIEAKKKELIEALPTNAEKQVEIFGSVIYSETESLF